MYGLYARQSIDKKDSVSVESQLEFCEYEAHGEPCKTYMDKGYSGKNMKRPGFLNMMEDIKHGVIHVVVVYKLDRISRSILDFANMMELFQEHNVAFISSTEKFDTSTPIGRAMLNICIVFAQLERETIQKRVADSYYSRSKRGFYMGGRIPYGFTKEKVTIDGIMTSRYVPISKECEQIKLLFSLYGNSSFSLGDILHYFQEHGIFNLRGSIWSSARFSEILSNPIYVKADINVYDFFKMQGANLLNSVNEFTGNHACYLYQGSISDTRRKSDLKDKEVVLAPHEGIISSEVWLKCRFRCLNHCQSTRTCKSKNSWLSGKVKCNHCKNALVIRKSKSEMGRYFVCSGKYNSNACKGTDCTIYANVLETFIEDAIKERLPEFKYSLNLGENNSSFKINKSKMELLQVQNELDDLMSKVNNAQPVLMEYINNKMEQLDREQRKLEKEIRGLVNSKIRPTQNYAEQWENASFENKQAVTDVLIKVIYIADGKMEVIWNI